MSFYWTWASAITGLLVMVATGARAQQGSFPHEDAPEPIWQMSGVVITNDSTSNGIFGVHLYNPESGRGTTSNYYGYFSLPVISGDSLVISAIGYKRESFVVPGNQDRDFSILIRLKEDTTLLPEVTVFPYPTEMAFKRAVLALNLPDQDAYGRVMDNLENSMMLARMEALDAGPEANHRWFMQRQQAEFHQRFGVVTNPLLNPFAWAQFIRSIKKKDD